MRKILNFSRNGIAAMKAAAEKAKFVAMGTGLAVMLALSGAAQAQTLAEQLAPTASNLSGSPVTGPLVSGAVGTGLAELPTVDASYSVLNDATQVKPASTFRQRNAAIYGVQPKDPCNPGCDVSFYTSYEALYFRRERDRNFSLSRNSFMPDFGYEYGHRITVGSLMDCTNGWEVVYAGPLDWRRAATVTGAGTLQSQFQPQLPYTAAEVDSFNNADLHVQAWRAQLQSFEFNRRWWVWDVISTMVGIRFIDYEEDYAFFSTNGGVGNGLFIERLDNQMVGIQAGIDLIQPISLRGNIGYRLKGGIFANFDERRTLLSNAGTLILNAGDTHTDWAGIIEFGAFFNYHIVPSVRVTAGYDFWFLPGVATIPEQAPAIVSPNSGTRVFNDDHLFIHGASVGVQVLF